MNKDKHNPDEPKAAPLYQNQVRLIGFLGKDPEHHENRAVLSLATKISWLWKDTGKWDSHTEWHRIVAWGELAEAVKPLAKGDYVLVEGELRSSLYHKEVGVGVDIVSVPITSWEIRARVVRKLVRKKKPAEKSPEPVEAAA